MLVKGGTVVVKFLVTINITEVIILHPATFLFLWSLIRIHKLLCNVPHNRIYGFTSLQWRHNGRDGVSNHQPHHCLFNRLSKKTSKLRVIGLCAGNTPVTGEFPAQMDCNADNVLPFDDVIMMDHRRRRTSAFLWLEHVLWFRIVQDDLQICCHITL